MPNWQKIFIVGFVVVMYLIIYSKTSIPFIYVDLNKNFLSLAIGYCVLAVWFSLHVIYGFNIEKNSVEKMQKNKSIAYIGFFSFPLMLGILLSSLAPIAADIFASGSTVREYKVVKVKPFSKSIRQLSKVHATGTGINRKPISFVLRNRMLNQLNLRDGERFLVGGRDTFAGFVIDDINDIVR